MYKRKRGASSSELSSPPDSEIEEIERREEDSLFVPIDRVKHHPKKMLKPSPQRSRSQQIVSSIATHLTAAERGREQVRRRTLHQKDYVNFIEAANNREAQRQYLATRNRVWKSAIESAQAQIETLDQQRDELITKIRVMSSAMKDYNDLFDHDMGADVDREIKKRYEDYFNLEIDDLDGSKKSSYVYFEDTADDTAKSFRAPAAMMGSPSITVINGHAEFINSGLTNGVRSASNSQESAERAAADRATILGGRSENEITDEESESEDADSESEGNQKFCFCERGDVGLMIGCDNPECKYEWFHLGCVGLLKAPTEDVEWYCPPCRWFMESQQTESD